MTYFDTGKSLSEALIFASINPKYDDRLLIELQVQYMKIPSSEQFMYTTCSELGVFMYMTGDSIINIILMQ